MSSVSARAQKLLFAFLFLLFFHCQFYAQMKDNASFFFKWHICHFSSLLFYFKGIFRHFLEIHCLALLPKLTQLCKKTGDRVAMAQSPNIIISSLTFELQWCWQVDFVHSLAPAYLPYRYESAINLINKKASPLKPPPGEGRGVRKPLAANKDQVCQLISQLHQVN